MTALACWLHRRRLARRSDRQIAAAERATAWLRSEALKGAPR